MIILDPDYTVFRLPKIEKPMHDFRRDNFGNHVMICKTTKESGGVSVNQNVFELFNRLDVDKLPTFQDRVIRREQLQIILFNMRKGVEWIWGGPIDKLPDVEIYYGASGDPIKVFDVEKLYPGKSEDERPQVWLGGNTEVARTINSICNPPAPEITPVKLEPAPLSEVGRNRLGTLISFEELVNRARLPSHNPQFNTLRHSAALHNYSVIVEGNEVSVYWRGRS
jgi:hypothetical protein